MLFPSIKEVFGNHIDLLDQERDFPDRYRFINGDIADKDLVQDVFEKWDPDWVVHFAAESHVDRSIMAPVDFIRTNINGTYNLLEASRMHWLLKNTPWVEDILNGAEVHGIDAPQRVKCVITCATFPTSLASV